MKAYLEMWIRYCKQNGIWFAVCSDGSIDQVSDCERDEDCEPDKRCMFGSKAAYEWLVRWYGGVKAAAALTAERSKE